MSGGRSATAVTWCGTGGGALGGGRDKKGWEGGKEGVIVCGASDAGVWGVRPPLPCHCGGPHIGAQANPRTPASAGPLQGGTHPLPHPRGAASGRHPHTSLCLCAAAARERPPGSPRPTPGTPLASGPPHRGAAARAGATIPLLCRIPPSHRPCQQGQPRVVHGWLGRTRSTIGWRSGPDTRPLTAPLAVRLPIRGACLYLAAHAIVAMIGRPVRKALSWRAVVQRMTCLELM